MHNRFFILHLSLIDGIGPAIIQRIIELQRSGVQASDLYLFSSADWQQKGGFTSVVAQKLVTGLTDKKILEEEVSLIDRHRIEWVTIVDERYPHLLREIYLPPAVLYWQGSFFNNCSVDDNRLLAVVGARKANNYGQYIINQIIPDLVSAQYTIVSGGALGIDAMAHTATLNAGGKTVAVLGSGLLRLYPTNNIELFKLIMEQGGSIVSSFPLRMEPFPGNFPARNRIISGLSRGCLVVQAAGKSGALISAHYAMEQGREVFAVPGPIDSELSIGCHNLIQNGAKLVVTSANILEEFGESIVIHSAVSKEPIKKNEEILTCKAIKDQYTHYSDEQKNIIAACSIPSYFDVIVETTQLSREIVQCELFNLQLDGVVEQDFSGMWKSGF